MAIHTLNKSELKYYKCCSQTSDCTQRYISSVCSGPGTQGLCFWPCFPGQNRGVYSQHLGKMAKAMPEHREGLETYTIRVRGTGLRFWEGFNSSREWESWFLLLLTQGVGRKAIYTSYLRPYVTSISSIDVSVLTFPLPTEGDSGSELQYLAQCKQTKWVGLTWDPKYPCRAHSNTDVSGARMRGQRWGRISYTGRFQGWKEQRPSHPEPWTIWQTA